ncbi:tetratricopeptide repeat protein 19, mitochondrial isoform X2 [Dunckerocampus dactyliophorus]|uniref:tetratricopeptide repeat protein 19, mitochondrial isoform X2 n=1 Tax=Dunckerocampus dactyliophorus TaxID=161453 RepID=UPI002406B393|nr:tetratricopeptide repeat protein 19, mitochondrial isoform X2 [Dunckerocampus dactyliophorus]
MAASWVHRGFLHVSRFLSSVTFTRLHRVIELQMTAIGWRPVQGVPRLLPKVSWDRLQHTPATVMRRRGIENGWMELQMSSAATPSAAKHPGGWAKVAWRGGAMCAMAALSFLSSSEDAQVKEDEMILLLKKAKLSILRGQLEAASAFLHAAVALAHQTHNHQAVVYAYSQMANLAYIQGQLDHAEKLFKAAMSFMLAGGMQQDDNAFIEMSLKLATIYAEQNKVELAEHGFRFCLETLEVKVQQLQETLKDQWTDELEALRKDTRLLLGLCLDSHARYRVATLHLKQAAADYEKALSICCQEQGESHPQTLVLMSDLATILDMQGHHDNALTLIRQAVDLGRSSAHPELHVLLGNMAGILLHTGQLDEAIRLYGEALSLAQQAGDQEAMERIREGLTEVRKRREDE